MDDLHRWLEHESLAVSTPAFFSSEAFQETGASCVFYKDCLLNIVIVDISLRVLCAPFFVPSAVTIESTPKLQSVAAT